MNSVAHDLKKYLVNAGLCTDEQMFVSRVPTVNLTENDQWGIHASPGSKIGGNILQWKRKHNVVIAYRNKSGDALYNKDDELQALLEACVSLEHYKVCQLVCNPMGELDTNVKELHVGQWQVTLDVITKNNLEES